MTTAFGILFTASAPQVCTCCTGICICKAVFSYFQIIIIIIYLYFYDVCHYRNVLEITAFTCYIYNMTFFNINSVFSLNWFPIYCQFSFHPNAVNNAHEALAWHHCLLCFRVYPFKYRAGDKDNNVVCPPFIVQFQYNWRF